MFSLASCPHLLLLLLWWWWLLFATLLLDCIVIASFPGQNQIVGVGDTGIDWDSCFFVDPAVPVPFNVVNMNHRKIVMFLSLSLF